MRLIKSTYDAHVSKVHSIQLSEWPDASQASVDSFLRQGQLTQLDKLFAEEEDLFGDNDNDEAPTWQEDDDDWFE
jgi:hypothetical protein